MTAEEILRQLKSQANPKNVAGMVRFGISGKKVLGISIPILRQMAKKIGKNHKLANQLYKSGIHEAKILASMIDDPALVSAKQMDDWIKNFDSWDDCDQVCMNLFCRTKHAFKKSLEWSRRKKELERRAGFALMACLAWQIKDVSEDELVKFFSVMKRAAFDERNYVRKAVNWALRQIGKRNLALNKLAIKEAKEIAKINSRAARWIAADALRELTSEAVQRRLKK